MTGNTLETFSYDSLHRLKQSQRTGAASTTVTYGYDSAGNFNFKSDFSLATGTPYNLSTGGLGGGGANAVKSVQLKAGGTRSYGYDASGNMTSDNAGFAAIYDHANLATKLQRGAVINNFIYGPNNAKARQTGTDGSKVYLGGYEDWITANQTKVSLGNYAQVTNGTGGRVLHYFLTDRLGSVDAVTDGNGNLIETRGYDAFGAPRTGVWGDATQIASTAITPKGFTSHEHLNSVQLIHMNGRMYDYQLGRFLGVDPFIQAPTNSQSLNPYSYIMNNPLSGTDPTGYKSECVGDTKKCPGSAPVEVSAEKNGIKVTQKLDGATGKVLSTTVSSSNGATSFKTTGNLSLDKLSKNDRSALSAVISSGTVAGFSGGAPRQQSADEIFSGSVSTIKNTGNPIAGGFLSIADSTGYGVQLMQWLLGSSSDNKRSNQEDIEAFENTSQLATFLLMIKNPKKLGQKLLSSGDDVVTTGTSLGRAGRQARLRELGDDPKLGSADKGWIRQESNSIERGQRSSIRNPPGKDLAHERGRESAKGYSYKHSNLQDRDLHRTQHKYDDFGRKNAERPLE